VSKRFNPPSAFLSGSYRVLPLRFRRLPWSDEEVFVTSMSGDWTVLPHSDLARTISGDLSPAEPLYDELLSRNLITDELSPLTPLISGIRTRKSYLREGPALHIFVVSLRCHHTCSYCQVSRQPTGASNFDMSGEAATLAVERLFEWPGENLTVEFQGGEPLLHFDRVVSITEAIVQANRSHNKRIQFVLASTLHDLSEIQLQFLAEHRFQLSTSLDGPEWLHNANRPRTEKDSYRRTLKGIEAGRRILGEDRVSALTTLTKKSLEHPEEIINEYVKQGFHSIFLRPLSPYGFALRTGHRIGYSVDDFLTFYRTALELIVQVNKGGYVLEESYASLLYSQFLTPFPHGYVDLRSPTGAGWGAIVYDYDGLVYPSDEARMLAAMGDRTWALGTVREPVSSWLNSPAMQSLSEAGVAEALPTCADCAYVPICGADPIDHYARQGDPIGHRPSSPFCAKQMGMMDHLIERWLKADHAERSIFRSWALPNCSRNEAEAA
jgi:His-Xaa-Ser repeat-associated upstream radical SAM protein